MLEARSMPPKFILVGDNHSSFEARFEKQGRLGELSLEAFYRLKGDYRKDLSKVPLFFLWDYFAYWLSGYGDLMRFCQKWNVFTIGELSKLTKYEFSALWAEANPHAIANPMKSADTMSQVLRCFNHKFIGERR
jgi:hypothetical protein